MPTDSGPDPAPVPELPQREATSRLSSLKQVFVLKPSPRRWPFALRAAVGLGAPLLLMILLGREDLGVIAGLGSFTALYGFNTPYRLRAPMLAGVALALILGTAVGVVGAVSPPLGLLIIVAYTTLATFVCLTLKVTPPGPFMLMMACGVGTQLHNSDNELWQILSVVTLGAASGWIAQMLPALFDKDGPETASVARSEHALNEFETAIGTPREDLSRHETALAMHNTWSMIKGAAPVRTRPSNRIQNLEKRAAAAHQRFATLVHLRDAGENADKRIAQDREKAEESDRVSRPSSLGVWHLLHRTLVMARSPIRNTTLRVLAATLIAGGLATLLPFGQVYWASAAALMVITAGTQRHANIQRGLERIAGTLTGLGLAGLILHLAPSGFGLLAVMVPLQFLIEVNVIRNYALAAFFITPLPLLIATVGKDFELGELLLGRGVDTLIGVAVGIAVTLLVHPRAAGKQLETRLGDVDKAINSVIAYTLKRGQKSATSHLAQQTLTHRLISMHGSFDVAMSETASSRLRAEELWPRLIQTSRLGYAVLAACWHQPLDDERFATLERRRLELQKPEN